MKDADLLNKVSTIQRKNMFVIWLQGVVFLITTGLLVFGALLYIPSDTIQVMQSGTPTKTPQSDFLKLVMPILAVFIGFIISFLGLRRLGQFDEEINNLRESLSNQIFNERNFNESQREQFRKEIGSRLDDIKATIQVVSEKHVSEAVDSRVQSTKREFDDFTEKSKGLIDEIELKLTPFTWLAEKKDEVESLSSVTSIAEARDQVKAFFAENKTDLAIRITGHLLQNNLTGSSSDFHNLAAELARNDQYSLASKVVESGVNKFPKNVDLLADGVKYFSEDGDLEKAECMRLGLEAVSKEFWNWRAFVFIGDYFENIGKFDLAIDIYEKLKESLPHDERAYSQHAGIYQERGQFDKAIPILEEGLKNTTKAPQVALRLAECCFETGQYEKAIEVLSRGLEGTAEAQPSVNISSLFWTRAKSRDALIHSGKLQSSIDTQVELAIEDYSLCLSMFDCIDQFGILGPQRVKVLMAYAKENNLDINVSEQQSGEDMLGMLKQLANMASSIEDGAK